MKKKVLALFLSAALCVTVFPATGVAAEFGSGDAEIIENAGDSQELFSAEETTEPMGETEQPAEDSEDIFWMTTKGKSRENICLSSCPKEVDKLTSRLLFQSEDFTTILTSATITSGNSDNYLMNYRYFINNIKFPYKKNQFINFKELKEMVKMI